VCFRPGLSFRAAHGGGLGIRPQGGDLQFPEVYEVKTMSRQFSLPTVIRMVNNELLAQFFVQLQNPCWGMKWSERPRRHVESVLQCLGYFEPKQREAAELIFRNVFDLACPTGVIAIRDAAKMLRPTLLEQWPDSLNPYCQAKVAPRLDAETLEWFARDISQLLDESQGRGQHCTIEHMNRDQDVDYFFCFPDDYVKTVAIHNQAGCLVTKTLRETFEIVFAYSRSTGTLELSARLNKPLKQQLEELFAWYVLQEQIGPRSRERVFDLNQLKRSVFQLETDPADQVVACLRKIRFDLPDRVHSITLESKGGTREDMQQMVQDCLNRERLSLEELEVSHAQFQLHFASSTPRGRGTMTFDVSHPDRCNLRRHQPERVAVAQKHLKMWNVVR
jgi:hypothetical protein